MEAIFYFLEISMDRSIIPNFAHVFAHRTRRWRDLSNLLTLIASIFAAAILLFILARIYRRITRKYSE
jgi:hypothetical protein